MRIVGGRFRGRPLASPASGVVRPTTDRVREAIFDILTSRLGRDLGGARVLDLFAGTGAMGLEALSRGARSCVFVDSGVEARGLLRENIERFSVAADAQLLRRSATELGPAGKFGRFDLVFADPPYGEGLGEKALASALFDGWLTDEALAVLEESLDAEIATPPGFELVDRRRYGDTQVTFLAPATDPDATGGGHRSAE
jgi:16S rRNA (guanine966-N2)-methyltransferase